MDIKTQNNLLVFLCSSLFLCFLSYFLLDQKYFVICVPLILSLFLLPIFNFKYLFYAVIFLTPLSVSLSDLGVFVLDTEMAFPTEPMLFGFMILTMFKHLFNAFLLVFK